MRHRHGGDPVDPPSPADQAPTADAGADQTADSGATADLVVDGSGSGRSRRDPIDAYAWTQTAGPSADLMPDTATPSFTAPTLAPGDPPATLTFQLEVCDPAPLCDTDTVVVTVNPPSPVNQAPTANAGADQTVASGATVNLTGAGSTDPDGDTLTYAWTQTGRHGGHPDGRQHGDPVVHGADPGAGRPAGDADLPVGGLRSGAALRHGHGRGDGRAAGGRRRLTPRAKMKVSGPGSRRRRTSKKFLSFPCHQPG